ncbi:hypothetical protein M0M57_11705 [Flavobacterium azooxidireducens]|uniref:Uncharacterized protein n=1 Tax=Flavobacterium azooxidireducens TaxID=1871076 RepID=A0ABY4KET7_9FLAO|nr:hypothetical protein [Flavobacterium azooxidireducens]UPQ78283.1 hypothetical protein M0M57_11705 [Flavobacterium azooxidireducens]
MVNFLGIFVLIQYLFFNSAKSIAVKPMLPFLVLTAISSLIELIFIYFLKFDSYIWSKLYTILEFVVFAVLFNQLLARKFVKITFCFSVLFFCAFFYFLLVNSNYPYLQVLGILYSIQFLYIFLFVILWIKEIFEKKEVESLLDVPLFYFVSGLLIYFSGTIFLFILGEEILRAGLSLYYYWIVNLVLVLIFRTFLILTIWKDRLI